MPILWTQNREIVTRQATEDEVHQAALLAVQAQLRLREHRQTRKKVNDSLDLEEAQIVRRLDESISRVANRKIVGVPAIVGYDLESGEVVLAEQPGEQELGRRPITPNERAAAENLQTK
jgi:anaerobic glycerol-3-phosphate dehydrogenase